ncbi:MAG: hypothetical protein QOJ94_1561 [Sphingomonadales bacterium]|jgi:hypothetical protein|nr:hypothetical protein [Sphingomonadales bacterium]
MRGSSENNYFARASLCFALGAAMALAGCDRTGPSGQQGDIHNASASTGGSPCPNGAAPQLAPTLPLSAGNSAAAGAGASVDCFAWQSFIALNWPTAPGATAKDFGKPRDPNPTVWETYREAAEVFGGKSSAPQAGGVKQLSRISKFGTIDLSDIFQAGSGHHWLTSQRGDVTHYEIRLNDAEYKFITQPNFDLRTRAGQLACASQVGKPDPETHPPSGHIGGMTLPSGSVFGWIDTDCTGSQATFSGPDRVGSIEIKAAWIRLPDDHSLDYRYKTATARIWDPRTRKSVTATVGLVGLHILRKTTGAQQWLWATFEQIDNSPDEGGTNGWSPPRLPTQGQRKPSPGYTYFNPDCDPSKNAYKCVHNAPPTPCLLGSTKCDPYDAPMQVTRLNPVDDTANTVTGYVWGLLARQAPSSVFNYYRLINVQWPKKSVRLQAQSRLPLPMGDPVPAGAKGGKGQIVANTSLETFQQSSASCMDCHANYASIATPKLLQTGGNGLRLITRQSAGAYASDYSFIFGAETKR